MNSRKTQVNKKLKALDKRLNNLNKRVINNAPVAISTRNSNKGKDYYRTNGKERISDVTAANSGFNIVDIFVNPANPTLFPWLSGIGTKYDLYRFKRLKFNYVPALPTSEEGNIYLGIDYNTLDPVPGTATDLCQLSNWTMNVVWKPVSINIEINTSWLYTRSGPVANADYKTYDLGRFFFATEGINYTGVTGYVEVEYDVEFHRRQPDYVNSVIPLPDVLNPFASMITTSTNTNSYASSFQTSITNSSAIKIENNNGRFTVDQALYGYINISSGSDNYGQLGRSSDGVNYNIIASNGNVATLEPGYYYKLYNNSAGSAVLSFGLTVIAPV